VVHYIRTQPQPVPLSPSSFVYKASRAARGDVTVAREFAEPTEGYVPAAMSQIVKIDSAAGRMLRSSC
jgi:hypothetical protein